MKKRLRHQNKNQHGKQQSQVNKEERCDTNGTEKKFFNAVESNMDYTQHGTGSEVSLKSQFLRKENDEDCTMSMNEDMDLQEDNKATISVGKANNVGDEATCTSRELNETDIVQDTLSTDSTMPEHVMPSSKEISELPNNKSIETDLFQIRATSEIKETDRPLSLEQGVVSCSQPVLSHRKRNHVEEDVPLSQRQMKRFKPPFKGSFGQNSTGKQHDKEMILSTHQGTEKFSTQGRIDGRMSLPDDQKTQNLSTDDQNSENEQCMPKQSKEMIASPCEFEAASDLEPVQDRQLSSTNSPLTKTKVQAKKILPKANLDNITEHQENLKIAVEMTNEEGSLTYCEQNVAKPDFCSGRICDVTAHMENANALTESKLSPGIELTEAPVKIVSSADKVGLQENFMNMASDVVTDSPVNCTFHCASNNKSNIQTKLKETENEIASVKNHRSGCINTQSKTSVSGVNLDSPAAESTLDLPKERDASVKHMVDASNTIFVETQRANVKCNFNSGQELDVESVMHEAENDIVENTEEWDERLSLAQSQTHAIFSAPRSTQKYPVFALSSSQTDGEISQSDRKKMVEKPSTTQVDCLKQRNDKCAIDNWTDFMKKAEICQHREQSVLKYSNTVEGSDNKNPEETMTKEIMCADNGKSPGHSSHLFKTTAVTSNPSDSDTSESPIKHKPETDSEHSTIYLPKHNDIIEQVDSTNRPVCAQLHYSRSSQNCLSGHTVKDNNKDDNNEIGFELGLDLGSGSGTQSFSISTMDPREANQEEISGCDTKDEQKESITYKFSHNVDVVTTFRNSLVQSTQEGMSKDSPKLVKTASFGDVQVLKNGRSQTDLEGEVYTDCVKGTTLNDGLKNLSDMEVNCHTGDHRERPSSVVEDEAMGLTQPLELHVTTLQDTAVHEKGVVIASFGNNTRITSGVSGQENGHCKPSFHNFSQAKQSLSDSGLADTLPWKLTEDLEDNISLTECTKFNQVSIDDGEDDIDDDIVCTDQLYLKSQTLENSSISETDSIDAVTHKDTIETLAVELAETGDATNNIVKIAQGKCFLQEQTLRNNPSTQKVHNNDVLHKEIQINEDKIVLMTTEEVTAKDNAHKVTEKTRAITDKIVKDIHEKCHSKELVCNEYKADPMELVDINRCLEKNMDEKITNIDTAVSTESKAKTMQLQDNDFDRKTPANVSGGHSTVIDSKDRQKDKDDENNLVSSMDVDFQLLDWSVSEGDTNFIKQSTINICDTFTKPVPSAVASDSSNKISTTCVSSTPTSAATHCSDLKENFTVSNVKLSTSISNEHKATLCSKTEDCLPPHYDNISKDKAACLCSPCTLKETLPTYNKNNITFSSATPRLCSNSISKENLSAQNTSKSNTISKKGQLSGKEKRNRNSSAQTMPGCSVLSEEGGGQELTYGQCGDQPSQKENDFDISDSQLCMLSDGSGDGGDRKNDENIQSKNPPSTPKANYPVLTEKRAEGQNLVSTILSELVTVNRQLLRLKREMEAARRKMTSSISTSTHISVQPARRRTQSGKVQTKLPF